MELKFKKSGQHYTATGGNDHYRLQRFLRRGNLSVFRLSINGQEVSGDMKFRDAKSKAQAAEDRSGKPLIEIL